MNISRDNYEAFMVAYIDGELNATEVIEFELFIKNNPDLKEELDAYKGLLFVSDEEVTFEEKEILLKKESSFILWKKMWPAAAAILLAIVIIPWLRNNHGVENRTLVKVVEPKKELSPKQKVEPQKIETVVKTDEEERIAPAQTKPKKVQKAIVKPTIVKQQVLNKKEALVKKEQEQIVQSKEPIELPLKEVIVQAKKSNNKPEPKKYLPEAKEELKSIIAQAPALPTNELASKTEGRRNIITISADKNPLIHEKLNEVVTKVEDRINKIRTIKKTPITVCIGKRKLFTLNTAKAAQAN